MQRDFLLDARLAVNEEVGKFNSDVREFGKKVRAFVKFFVAFLLFAMLNLWIDVFTKHTHLLSAHTFRLLEEGLHAFVNQNVLAFVSIITERHLLATAIMALASVFCVDYIASVLATANTDDKGDRPVRDHKQFAQDSVKVYAPVSYKQKVSFLS